MRAFEACFNTQWAITPDALALILTIANREGTDAMLAAALERREQRHQAVAAQEGRPLDKSSLVTLREGIAILAITGPIVRYADFFSEISGATSVQALARDFTRVVNDPAVSGIVLNTDSPGGEVNGIAEFAAMVHAARGTKPIVAYVSDLGASAAYWIASAADEIVVAKTALVGSIGVVAAVRDPSKTAAKDIEFVSSQSPKKRADPTTEAGRSQIQAIVDDLATIFVDAVALHRGVTADTVLAEFGQGGVFVGEQAVTAGLVDRIGSFEGVVADLQERARQPRTNYPARRGATAHSHTKEPTMATLMERFWAKFGAMDEDEAKVGQAPTPAVGLPLGTQIAGGLVSVPGTTPPLAGHSAFTIAPPSTTGYSATGTASSAGPGPDPEVDRLRAELAKVRAEGITKDATAFADAVISARRAYPAERSALVAAYTQAALDDAAYGMADGAQPRTALLQAACDARPAHRLTEELIPAGQTVEALGNLQVTDGSDAPMTPERRTKLLKLTPVGQAAVNSKQT